MLNIFLLLKVCSCCFFNFFIMLLKFLLSILNSSSVSTSGTFVSNSFTNIFRSSNKIYYWFSNLVAKEIAITVERNNNKSYNNYIYYCKRNFMPVCCFQLNSKKLLLLQFHLNIFVFLVQYL